MCMWFLLACLDRVTFISDSSFALSILALKFGVCMCYFLIGNYPHLEEKDYIWIFHELLGARQHRPKNNEKNKPSSLIVMILQYAKNLWLNFFTIQ